MVNKVDRVELKLRAKQIVKENYGTILLLTLIYVVTGIANVVYSKYGAPKYYDVYESMTYNIFTILRLFLVSVILTVIQAPLVGGILNIIRGKDYRDAFGILSSGTFWLTTFLTNFLVGIIVAFGFMLLVVPGIIFGLGLSQVVCLIYDISNTPEVKENIEETGILAPIKVSWRIMNGHKADFFILALSFLLWSILTGLTFGLAGFYTVPYIHTTNALWYNELLKEKGLLKDGDEDEDVIESETSEVEQLDVEEHKEEQESEIKTKIDE